MNKRVDSVRVVRSKTLPVQRVGSGLCPKGGLDSLA